VADRVEVLEVLREQSGLAVDREGRVLHRGAPVEHPRAAAVLAAGLDVDEAGRAVVRVGREWAYVTCERSPFVIVALRPDVAASRLRARLNTGREITIGPGSGPFVLRGQSDLWVRLPGRSVEARFGRAAWAALHPFLEIDEGSHASIRIGHFRAPLVAPGQSEVEREDPPRQTGL
jgi:hypothetical protein